MIDKFNMVVTHNRLLKLILIIISFDPDYMSNPTQYFTINTCFLARVLLERLVNNN